MPVDVGHCITDPFEARGEGAKHCTRLSAKKLRPVLWVGLGYRARRGKMGSWNWLEHTVARKIAQVESSGGDFCRHVEGSVLELCDQLVRRGRGQRWKSRRSRQPLIDSKRLSRSKYY